jgi:MFS family permease
LCILCVLYVLSTIDRQIISMLVKPIERDLSIDDVAMGVLIGPAFGLFYTTAGLAMGWAVDRFSRRLVIYCGVTLWAIGATCCGLSSTYAELLVARFAVGLGEAALTPAAHAIISERFQASRRSLALSIFTVSNLISTGLAVILGGFVISFADRTDAVFSLPLFGELAVWQFLFVVTGAPGIVLALLAWLLPNRVAPRTDHHAIGAPSESFGSFVRQRGRALFSVMLGCAIVTIGNYAMSGWLPTGIARRFNLEAHAAGLWFAAIVIIPGAIGQIASGTIVDAMVRRGIADAPIRYFATVCLLGMPFAVGAFMATDVRVFAGLLMVYYLLVFPNLGYSAAAIQAITPSRFRGRASGLMLFVIGVLGAGIGTTSVGAMAEYLYPGPTGLFFGLATLLCLIVPLGALMMWQGRHAYRAAVAAEAQASLNEGVVS